MNIAIAMVMSLDGRTTDGQGNGPYVWASHADQQHFRQLIAAHDCVVMGGKTYSDCRDVIQPSADKPRFVVTRHPEKFATDAGRPGMFFVTGTPAEIIATCEAAGAQNILLVGGAATSARFVTAGLADELFLTVEPALFGQGEPLVGELLQAASLQLQSAKQANAAGTLLLHYQIKKEG